jgi:hypothetical protein
MPMESGDFADAKLFFPDLIGQDAFALPVPCLPFARKAHPIRVPGPIKERPMAANRRTISSQFLSFSPKLITLLCLAPFLLLALDALAQEGTIITFDPPASVQTVPLSINSGGWITGYYDNGSAIQGFLRSPDGSFTTISPPGSTWAQAWSINSAGWITGSFAAGNRSYGFVRTAAGSYAAFNPPDSTSTMPQSINSAGAVTGSYSADKVAHGFLREPDGTIVSFDPSGSTSTQPRGINAAGVITGYYLDSDELDHGFVRTPDGTITTFDVQSGQNTQPASINSEGEITGIFGQLNDPGGFLRMPDGTITTVVPNDPLISVSPYGINDLGDVTGFAQDPDGQSYGFIRQPGNTFATFVLPGVTYFLPFGINSAGEVTGYYQASVFTTAHGFLRMP